MTVRVVQNYIRSDDTVSVGFPASEFGMEMSLTDRKPVEIPMFLHFGRCIFIFGSYIVPTRSRLSVMNTVRQTGEKTGYTHSPYKGARGTAGRS